MKYWVLVNGEVPGNYEPAELTRIPGFSATAMVCPTNGHAEERNWQRAGLFPEILRALELAAAPASPAPGAQSEKTPPNGVPLIPLSPSDVVNSTSEKIFRHVSDLMRELENRREERALTQSLERSLCETKAELQAARERIRSLEDRASLIPGYEDRERKLQEFLQKARAELKDKEQETERAQRDADALRKQLQQLSLLDAERDSLRQRVEQLTRQISDKEFALAQALSVLERLEKEMGHILPNAISGISREIPRPHDERRPSAPPKVSAAPPPAPKPEPVNANPPVKVALSEVPAAPPASPRRDPIPTPAPAPKASASYEPKAKLSAPSAVDRPRYTRDEGKPETPASIPPEGELRPISPPWMEAAKTFLTSLLPFGLRSGSGKSSLPASLHDAKKKSRP